MRFQGGGVGGGGSLLFDDKPAWKLREQFPGEAVEWGGGGGYKGVYGLKVSLLSEVCCFGVCFGLFVGLFCCCFEGSSSQ